MKTNIISIACYLMAILAFSGCKKDNDFREVSVTEVNTLYAPDDGRNLVLQAAGSASLYFEWEKAIAQDNGVVYYDVLFDKENGDFSNPVFTVTADNKGTSTGASITHKTLNKIAGLAGIAASEEGTLKWTIVSSRGLTKTPSKQVRKLNVTRFAGIEAPSALFLTGEGSEGGADLAQALAVKTLEGGTEFEIYTRLTAGKKYTFVDSKTGTSRTFSVTPTGTAFQENAEGATVAKDGIYKINLDFLAGSASIVEVNKLDFFMCTPQKRQTLTYQGKGVWRVNDMVPDFTTEFGDDRYFFWITLGGVEQKIGSINKDNQPPSGKTGPYFKLSFHPEDKNRWDYSFKFPNRSIAKCNVIVTMNADVADYTHEIVF